MLKHSFQSNTLRSRDGGDSEDSTSSSDEEQELKEKMMLKKEKVKAELKAELARDIWQHQTGSKGGEADQDPDKWKGFGVDLSTAEKNKNICEREEKDQLKEQYLCLILVGFLLVFSLILYGVHLHFVMKAATC